MARKRRVGKKLAKSLLPIVLVLVLALAGVLAFLTYSVTRPQRRAYLVTPQAFAQISGPVIRITDERWVNRRGDPSRGWLLRGAEGAPGVVFLHRYGADRSWLFNLGVKLNETTSFSVLWPDLRGHGLEPLIRSASLGTYEGIDVEGAVEFLRSLRTETGNRLIADDVGLYGVELGGYAAMDAAVTDEKVRALVLDSVPSNPDELLRSIVSTNTGLDNDLLYRLSRGGLRLYFLGRFNNTPACRMAEELNNRAILLLSGVDAGYLRSSTVALNGCFPDTNRLELHSDLSLTGFNLPSATGEQGETYDRRVIDFFDRNLR